MKKNHQRKTLHEVKLKVNGETYFSTLDKREAIDYAFNPLHTKNKTGHECTDFYITSKNLFRKKKIKDFVKSHHGTLKEENRSSMEDYEDELRTRDSE